MHLNILYFLCIFIFSFCFEVDSTPVSQCLNDPDDRATRLFHKYPFVVYLEYYFNHVKLGLSSGRACSGSIISQHRVLTAASCLDQSKKPFDKLFVKFNLPLWKKNTMGNEVIANTTHKMYGAESGYDLAVLKLKSPIIFDDNRKSIDMFDYGEEIEPGTEAKIIKFDLHHNLEIIEMITTEKPSCEKGKEREIYTYNEFEGTARKDAGSPLVVDGKLAGVVSRNLKYKMKIYDVSTDVASFRNWIDLSISDL